VSDPSVQSQQQSPVWRHEGILGGRAVFAGTRVPVATLFEYLADGLSIAYYLKTFPTVSMEQVRDVLNIASRLIEGNSPRVT
jgi:uncharacterized protein (DUF433 family)